MPSNSKCIVGALLQAKSEDDAGVSSLLQANCSRHVMEIDSKARMTCSELHGFESAEIGHFTIS
jgi:hypothetical protein